MSSDLGNKAIMAKNIQYYMDINKKTRNDICTDLGFSYTTFCDWVNAKTYPRIDKIELMANYFGIEKSDLVEDKSKNYRFDNVFPVKKQKIPLLGEIACGKPIFADEDRESYIAADADLRADFCLKAKGDSMINARILDGDIVFIRRQPMVDNGEIAAVRIGNEATLKRVYYYPDAGKLILTPENPAHEPLVYIGEELNEIEILGKAIAFQSDVR